MEIIDNSKEVDEFEPLVSIIIPTYNRADIIPVVSIQSVLNQIYKNWELIIVDDGSTDNTKGVCDNFTSEDKRIKYFFQENRGQGAARNFGIKKSSGKYILFLDSDDALLPGMINEIMNNFLNDYDYVACRRWVFNGKKNIFDVNTPNPSCVIFKRELFNKIGYFDEANDLRGIEDADFSIQMEMRKKKQNLVIKDLVIDKPLVVYLEHENQETNHSDLARLNKKTSAIISKYKDNLDAPRLDLSIKYKESGNFDIILNNIDEGRKKLIKSLKLNFNTQAIVLLIFSFLGVKFYRNFVYNFKNFREKKLWKIRLQKAIKKYPDFYSQAKKITSTYKNW